jgi:hypothetical protein
VRTVVGRIDKLEDQLGTGEGEPQILLVVSSSGWEGAMDENRCIQILGETGFLPTGRIGVVNLLTVPKGLDARQKEAFLRENAAELCGIRAKRADRRTGKGRAGGI